MPGHAYPKKKERRTRCFVSRVLGISSLPHQKKKKSPLNRNALVCARTYTQAIVFCDAGGWARVEPRIPSKQENGVCVWI